MKLRVAFTIEEGPASIEQLAACKGFADSLGIQFSLEFQGEPKKERIVWNSEFTPKDKEQRTAFALLSEPELGSPLRKPFVRELAKRLKRPAKFTGITVSRWIKEGVLKEV